MHLSLYVITSLTLNLGNYKVTRS